MKTIHLIAIGKMKYLPLCNFESEYTKRLSQFEFHIHELKSKKDDTDLEGKDLLTKYQTLNKKNTGPLILLSEKGKQYSSLKFSKQLFAWFNSSPKIFFMISGAAGFSKEVEQKAKFLISLSSMTFPHQICRLLFIEQVYRAQSIIQKHPYSK